MSLEKLKIEAYDNVELSGDPIDTFTTLLNPENFSINYEVEYKEEDGEGSSLPNLSYQKTKLSDLEVKFLLDSTGIINSSNEDVTTQVNKFKKLVYTYNGDKHRPNFVKIVWGALLFKGVLTKMKVDFKLFKPNGDPLRAEITASFKNTRPVDFVVRKENKSSPDLTHIRTVKAGDTLPLMCYRIYGQSKYFLEVAKVNKLLNFRKLVAGQEIFFPPIEQLK